MVANIFSYFGRALSQKKVTIHDENGELLEIDATISEDHKASAQATTHEIEDGSDISDHIVKKGITLSLTGIISDDPINIYSTMLGTASGITGSLIGGKSGAIATGVIGKIGGSVMQNLQGKPSKSAHDIMLQIYEEGLICSVITGLATYTNLILEDYSAPRTEETQRSLKFTAKFRQVVIANSETVDIPAAEKEAGAVSDGDSKNKNLGTLKEFFGQQDAKTPTSAVSGKGESFLYGMTH